MKNHLFIGLGGQGGRTLAELRKVMAQRRQDTERLKAAGMRLEFLAIDSSSDVRNELKYWNYFGEDLSMGENDWLELSPVTSAQIETLAIRRDVSGWIGNRDQLTNFLAHNKIEGANQRRRFGRVLFAHNADRIRTAIFQQKVAKFTTTGAQQCAFHVFASLAGGTGSGCIVDLIATLRAQYPSSDLNAYPIFVYVYATHNDGRNSDVGYFYQNQFAALRDLNALMCEHATPPLRLHLLGNQVSGRIFEGSEAIAQLVLTSSVNRNNIGVPLADQIHIIAESCFERISAFASGQMSANTQRSITGQDVIPNFPGEPARRPERSYRFSGIGMRRWEVPHRAVEELLALDVLTSSLRQMLYSNWEDNRGFADKPTSVQSSVSDDCLTRLEGLISGCSITNARLAELTRDFRSEVGSIAESMLREGGHDLAELESRVKTFYDRGFRGEGGIGVLQSEQRNQTALIDEAIQQIDSVVTSFWLDPATPVALVHLGTILEAFNGALRAKLENRVDVSQADARIAKVCSARQFEWSKITPLSALVGKRAQLFRAHARDLVARYELDLQRRAAGADDSFIREIITKVTALKTRYDAAQDFFAKRLEETTRESRELSSELQAMRSGEGANKYEFDPEALARFLPVMRAHSAHQRNSAVALRQRVSGELGRPLSAVKSLTIEASQALDEAMRQTAMERSKAIHQALEVSGEAPRILEDSLLKRLEERIGGNETALAAEIFQFVERTGSCLHLRAGETQPQELLGQQLGVAQMPRRILLLGLPGDHAPFANKVKEAFLAARRGGEDLIYDTYTHDDPTQLRLLLMDYWMAARFTTVAHELGKSYKDAARGGSDTAYFCNLDSAGEKDQRPSLFLPTPQERKQRYEADLWLGQQERIGAIEAKDDGVFLIRKDGVDGPEVRRLGDDLKALMETAHLNQMIEVHEAVSAAAYSLGDERPTVVTSLIKRETDRIAKEQGLTSPEYLRWQAMRPHLQSFAN